MSLIYAGIDEAGYGPLLGPLCVGLSVLRIDNWTEEASVGHAPDVWKLLSRAVCREGRDGRRRIAVDDSKNLKLANSSVSRHPVYHLERAVASFLACLKGMKQNAEVAEEAEGTRSGVGSGHALPGSDLELFSALRVSVPDSPWYAGGGAPGPFPVGSSREELGILANTLDLALGEAGVSVLGLDCEVLGESAFNQIVAAAGTKAAATEAALIKHLWTVWERFAGAGAEPGSAVRVVCDRQGGRTNYTEILSRAFPGCSVRETHANQTQSRYEIAGGGSAGHGRDQRMCVLFMTESESAHMPVALASMVAKLSRELLMARFNRYWCARIPELKPTAGYRGDGQRWLAEAGAVISGEERVALIRRA